MTPDGLRPVDENDLDERLSTALQSLAPEVGDAAVWPGLQPRVARARRRRNLTRAAAGLALVLGAFGAWQAFAALERDPVATAPTVTHPAAPDGSVTPATAPPTSVIDDSALLPHDTDDPRVDVVRRWTAAVAAGDVATAWGLMDAKSQQMLGSPDALAGPNDSRGQFDSSDDVRYQVIDGARYGREGVTVVTSFGTLPLGDRPYPAWSTLLVIDDGVSGLKVAELPSATSGAPPYEPLRLLSLGPRQPVVDPSITVTFALPTEYADAGADPAETRVVPGPVVLAFDGVLAGPQEWERADVDGVPQGTYQPAGSAIGEHVVTLVQFREDGRINVAGSRLFSVAPAAHASLPPGVTPYFDDAAIAKAEKAFDAYLRAIRENDSTAFAATVSSAEADIADRLFETERARCGTQGKMAYYPMGDDVRFNFWQEGGWYFDWAPWPHPSEPTLSLLRQWLQDRPEARLVACVGMADGTTRTFALETAADGIFVRALGTGDLKGLDLLGRTPADVMSAYLEAQKAGDYSTAYALIGNPELDRDAYVAEMKGSGESLVSYEIGDWELVGDDVALVMVSFKSRFADGHTAEGANEGWRAERVDGVWKVGWLPRQ